MDLKKRSFLAGLGALGAAVATASAAESPSTSKKESNTEAGGREAKSEVITEETSEPLQTVPKRDESDLQLPQPSVTLNRRPSDEIAWNSIKKLIVNDLRLTDTANASGSLSNRYLHIGYAFSFKSKSTDTDFSPFHVEPLIDQAADLLDRGQRDRASWDELGAKWATLSLELQEFVELDEIHTREEAAGVYEVAAKQSLADMNAETSTMAGAATSNNIISGIINSELSYSSINELSGAAQKAAWVSGLASYSFGGGDFNGYYVNTFNGVSDTVANHLLKAAATQSFSTLYRERLYAQSQQISLSSTRDTSENKFEGYKAKFIWDWQNRNFLKERTLVARRLQEIKSKLATDPNGILNHAKRMDALQQRFQNDFRDAIARLNAVRQGLKEIYGYDVELPQNQSSSTYFDDCLIWCRTAIQWLVRFSRMEQSAVIPISIRSILGDDDWSAGLKSGTWTLAVRDRDLPGMNCVRVRGLSAISYVGLLSDEDRLWQLSISPPVEAIHSFSNGEKIILDQSRIPPAKLFRVTSRKATRDPDVVGLSAWFNISPIGKWRVSVLGSIPAPCLFSKLSDITLDILVSYRHE